MTGKIIITVLVHMEPKIYIIKHLRWVTCNQPTNQTTTTTKNDRLNRQSQLGQQDLICTLLVKHKLITLPFYHLFNTTCSALSSGIHTSGLSTSNSSFPETPINSVIGSHIFSARYLKLLHSLWWNFQKWESTSSKWTKPRKKKSKAIGCFSTDFFLFFSLKLDIWRIGRK